MDMQTPIIISDITNEEELSWMIMPITNTDSYYEV